MTKIEISLKTIFSVIAVVAGLFVLSRVTDILVQVFIAFVLMTALNPIVSRLQKLGFSKTIAILSTYFVMLGSLIVIVASMIPAFVDQTSKLLTQLNISDQAFLEPFMNLKISSTQFLPLLTQYSGSLGKVIEVIVTTFSAVFTIFTVLVMGLYFLLGRDHIHTYFTILFRTENRKERSKKLVDSIETALGSWVRGEFILMLSIGILTFLGLSILNVPFALPLAIFAGLMEALPNLGPTLSAIPAVIVAVVSVSPIMGGVTAILYTLVQIAENNFIVPQVMKRTVGIRPLTTIVFILIGFRFGGVLGALLSLPLFIVARQTLIEMSPEIRELTN